MSKPLPPDQAERERALEPANSILVQAPAGSGKTELLTRRFLRLLREVEDPGQIVAITFTKAAAAEMRHRILSKLEEADRVDDGPNADEFSMETLARRALDHAQALGWNLLDQPAQLRISTIDSFCRDVALQQPLLSGLGDGLGIYENPDELYRRAARLTLEQIDSADPALQSALEELLLWRDNNWHDLENQMVEMLRNRDRWMQGFVLEREQDWDALRARLERPFAKANQEALSHLSSLLDQVPGARDEALKLARFACEEPGPKSPWALAECAEIPSAPFADGLESAREIYACLGVFLQTQKGAWRSEKGLKAPDGFPATPRGKTGKAQFSSFIVALAAVPGLEFALANVRNLPPARYTDEDWQIVRACFTVLRNAAGQLRVVFAEAGAVDYIEVAQIALNVLKDADGQPTDAALSIADGIRHILVDEFQDTSRRQHELLRRLIAAWPERGGRSCFVVGDPMQSIYFFRDADAELFPRVRENGLEIPGTEALHFDSVALTSNFRTAKPLVENLNEVFEKIFASEDGSGITFSRAEPARDDDPSDNKSFMLHIQFQPQAPDSKPVDTEKESEKEVAQAAQIKEIVALIQGHLGRMEQARAQKRNYRIAVLGRTRSALAPIAEALREAAIPFRAVDLEKLSTRPEVLDARALACALLNPLDRVAWLGILRAPWCGLSLADLHALTSGDHAELLARPVSELLRERLHLLSREGVLAVERILEVLDVVPDLRFDQPTASLGTWLEQVWARLGGAQCVDRTGRANLDLFWKSLDGLPNGEQDLLGSALDAALDKLTAQPDPDSESTCGIQLMTIHKSKGLEFEVVIVPELQAGSGRGRPKLLSWLERGIPPEDQPDETDGSDEVTEFLVAPLQSKGAERGTTKAWVDRIYRERESQETRRILYVAATRARDELHFFARPACKQEDDGSWTLATPSGSLLATAWPAMEAEIRNRFEVWKEMLAAESELEPLIVESIAASGSSNLVFMPAPAKPAVLRRLPPEYRRPQDDGSVRAREAQVSTGFDIDRLYQRHEGGLLSRAFGTAVHALLEQLACLNKGNDWAVARSALKQFEPRIAAQIRAAGVNPSKAAGLTLEAIRLALEASEEPLGNWILSPHAEDESEARWTGVMAGSLRTVQVDRVFLAGMEPLSTGDEAWWIIDYKTSHADGLDPAAALPKMRESFAPQLEIYAEVLRKLHGDGAPMRAGLYYPRMSLFDWWEI